MDVQVQTYECGTSTIFGMAVDPTVVFSNHFADPWKPLPHIATAWNSVPPSCLQGATAASSRLPVWRWASWDCSQWMTCLGRLETFLLSPLQVAQTISLFTGWSFTFLSLAGEAPRLWRGYPWKLDASRGLRLERWPVPRSGATLARHGGDLLNVHSLLHLMWMTDAPPKKRITRSQTVSFATCKSRKLLKYISLCRLRSYSIWASSSATLRRGFSRRSLAFLRSGQLTAVALRADLLAVGGLGAIYEWCQVIHFLFSHPVWKRTIPVDCHFFGFLWKALKLPTIDVDSKEAPLQLEAQKHGEVWGILPSISDQDVE